MSENTVMTDAATTNEGVTDSQAAVSVATEPDFQVSAGRNLLRTWILLNFKQEQRLELAEHRQQLAEWDSVGM